MITKSLIPNPLPKQKACHPAATAFVDCENDDQQCACIRQEGVISNTTACAERTCEDPEGDLKGMCCGLRPFSCFSMHVADDRVVFIELFDEVCDKFNISVPATGGNESSSGAEVRAEKWTSGNGGSYGGGGGGSWRSGAAGSVVGDALLQWAFGGVACAVTLGIMF